MRRRRRGVEEGGGDGEGRLELGARTNTGVEEDDGDGEMCKRETEQERKVEE